MDSKYLAVGRCRGRCRGEIRAQKSWCEREKVAEDLEDHIEACDWLWEPLMENIYAILYLLLLATEKVDNDTLLRLGGPCVMS